ncbi:hypothetical protein EGR_06318 [Echinococcus granulosus]|uniref:Uncharacterized protein n=1 Tax=Echinococcus granulosus TaxID=6210 RepID=W6UYW8_ECHGR|nr:hypothetical protein EGR_06318 [Echinococcus granulosus]EUB58769.1 hypothetical protein EGR_06318 [Echinococcus granulosus]
MTKTARLTWGLSMRRLKIPSFLLDAGIYKQTISTSSFVAASTAFKLKPLLLSRHRHIRAPLESSMKQMASSDDSELALIIDSHKVGSKCTKGKVKMIHAGVSDPGMRFLIYLVSLALSLAALSILKLHKLLEWLMVDSDTPVTARLQELRTKSALISEILRAAAFRYTQCVPHPSVPVPLSKTSTLQSHQQQPLYPITPTSTSSMEALQMPFSSGMCFHTCKLATAMSAQCLLCLMRNSEEDVYPSLDLGRQRCHSESTIDVPPVRWSKPSRPNAGICRAQVISNASSICLSVEMCSGHHSPFTNKSGLYIASDVKNGASRFWRLSADSVTQRKLHTEDSSSSSTPLFHRSPKLVACVAPTSTSIAAASSSSPSPPSVRSSSSSKVALCALEFWKTVPRTTLFATLQEMDQEFENVFNTEEARAVNLAAASSVKRCYFHPRPQPILFPSIPVVRRDCAVDARRETREAATSPLVEEDLEEGDHPEAEGLELDDEGVYFTFDLHNRTDACFEEYTDQDEEECEGCSTEPRETHKAGVRYGEGLSDLVALTNSISDDLLQLESGCQELINRVHANRIELDRVNDSLSFVWNTKDECTSAPATSTSVSVMENSWSSGGSCSVFTHRYSPMGASFISSSGSCCPCNCHREELVEAMVNQPDPELSSEMLSSLTLVHSESLPDEKFFHSGFCAFVLSVYCHFNAVTRFCRMLVTHPTYINISSRRPPLKKTTQLRGAIPIPIINAVVRRVVVSCPSQLALAIHAVSIVTAPTTRSPSSSSPHHALIPSSLIMFSLMTIISVALSVRIVNHCHCADAAQFRVRCNTNTPVH